MFRRLKYFFLGLSINLLVPGRGPIEPDGKWTPHKYIKCPSVSAATGLRSSCCCWVGTLVFAGPLTLSLVHCLTFWCLWSSWKWRTGHELQEGDESMSEGADLTWSTRREPLCAAPASLAVRNAPGVTAIISNPHSPIRTSLSCAFQRLLPHDLPFWLTGGVHSNWKYTLLTTGMSITS